MKSSRRDLELGAVEVVDAPAGGHVEPVLLVVDLDLVEPDAGVEAQQAHVEVVAGVGGGISSRRRKPGTPVSSNGASSRWPDSARRLAEPGPGLVAALDPEHLRRRPPPASSEKPSPGGR